jgi:hypothetical protein
VNALTQEQEGKEAFDLDTHTHIINICLQHVAYLPKSVLDCKVVAREMEFSSKHKINNFQLHQRIFVNDYCVEGGFFY